MVTVAHGFALDTYCCMSTL